MEQLDQAICTGETRFKGISSHDSALGPPAPHGYLCFKTFGAGKLLGDTSGYNQPLQEWPDGMHHAGRQEPLLPHMSVEQCLHYTLTCDPDVALLGLSDPTEQDAAFAAAQGFTAPLDPEQMMTI